MYILLFSFLPKREAVRRVFSLDCTEHCQIVPVVVRIFVCHLAPLWAFFDMYIQICYFQTFWGFVVLNILLHCFVFLLQGLQLYECHTFFVLHLTVFLTRFTFFISFSFSWSFDNLYVTIFCLSIFCTWLLVTSVFISEIIVFLFSWVSSFHFFPPSLILVFEFLIQRYFSYL